MFPTVLSLPLSQTLRGLGVMSQVLEETEDPGVKTSSTPPLPHL